MQIPTVTVPKPDDGHIHLRDGPYLHMTVAHAASQFGRVWVMPNVDPPITTLAALDAYYHRIRAAIPPGMDLSPLMTLYVQPGISIRTLEEACKRPYFIGCKLYPHGITTNAHHGVRDLSAIEPLLEAMERAQIPLLIHAEVPDPQVDIFDREAYFIDRVLAPWVTRFPGLRISMEHITTRYAVDFIRSTRQGVGGSITAHHLLINRNHVLSGGIKPDLYCMPIAKRWEDQLALCEAAMSGDPRFFLGTDSAPHPQHDKYQACGCAGIYTAHAALELYATAFDSHNRLDQLDAFIRHTSQFYQLPPPRETVTLVREPCTIPLYFPYPPGSHTALTPFYAGQTLPFQRHSASGSGPITV